MVKTYYCDPKTDQVTVRYKGHAHREIKQHIGPNQKGRSLLLDAFGIESCSSNPCICENKFVDIAHQAFTEEIIMNLPKDELWQLNQFDICDWVFDHVSQQMVLEEELVTT